MRDFADRITWVVVADGQKALVMQQEDADARPILRVLSAAEIKNPRTREQGTSRPGRMNDYGAARSQRSAMEETDWHRLEKERFAKDFTGALNRAALANAFDRIVIFAPPQTLGEMRGEYHGELQKRIAKEVASDLTNHPVDDIEKQTAAALASA